MVCPFTIAVRIGIAAFVLKQVYDAVCIYRKNHGSLPADDDETSSNPSKSAEDKKKSNGAAKKVEAGKPPATYAEAAAKQPQA